MNRLENYARHQRYIRSLQPKVSSEEANAQARRVLAALDPTPKKASKAKKSSGGRPGMAG